MIVKHQSLLLGSRSSNNNLDIDDDSENDEQHVNLCDFLPEDITHNNRRNCGCLRMFQAILLALMQIAIIIFIATHIYGNLNA